MSVLGPTGKCSKRRVRTLDQVIGTLAARTRTFVPRHCCNISALYRNWDKTKVLSQFRHASYRFASPAHNFVSSSLIAALGARRRLAASNALN